MKHSITPFVLLVFFPLLLSAQEKKAVTGKIKSTTVYEQKFEKGSAGKVMVESFTRYDVSGNITEEIDYKQGRVDKHLIYKYDTSGNKIQETELDATGKKIKVTEYKYNAANLRTERTVYDDKNQVVSKKTYKYDLY